MKEQPINNAKHRPRYEHNPFVEGLCTKSEMRSAGFWLSPDGEPPRFVKLYGHGAKALKDLTRAGTKVFEVLYFRIQENIGKDRVCMALAEVDQALTPMSEATYTRGMRELITKGFIAATPTQGWYWVNPSFVWNGDRLAFVKQYWKAPSHS